MTTEILQWAYNAFTVLVLSNAIISWFPRFRWHPVGRVIFNVTEPLFCPIRRRIPPLRIRSGVALDFAPVLLLLVAWISYYLLVAGIRALGMMK